MHGPMGPMFRSILLSANITSGPVIGLINITEYEIFHPPYLKINNSTVKEYFLIKFCGSFKNISTKWAKKPTPYIKPIIIF